MKAIVYGKDNCPHCDSALMRRCLVGAEVGYIKVGEDITVQELRDKLSQEFGIGEVKTVPQIIIDGEYIGGDRELKEWLYNKVYSSKAE